MKHILYLLQLLKNQAITHVSTLIYQQKDIGVCMTQHTPTEACISKTYLLLLFPSLFLMNNSGVNSMKMKMYVLNSIFPLFLAFHFPGKETRLLTPDHSYM